MLIEALFIYHNTGLQNSGKFVVRTDEPATVVRVWNGTHDADYPNGTAEWLGPGVYNIQARDDAGNYSNIALAEIGTIQSNWVKLFVDITDAGAPGLVDITQTYWNPDTKLTEFLTSYDVPGNETYPENTNYEYSRPTTEIVDAYCNGSTYYEIRHNGSGDVTATPTFNSPSCGYVDRRRRQIRDN